MASILNTTCKCFINFPQGWERCSDSASHGWIGQEIPFLVIWKLKSKIHEFFYEKIVSKSIYLYLGKSPFFPFRSNFDGKMYLLYFSNTSHYLTTAVVTDIYSLHKILFYSIVLIFRPFGSFHFIAHSIGLQS